MRNEMPVVPGANAPEPSGPDKSADARGVAALERGLRIIGELGRAGGDAQSLAALAKSTGFYKSTILRLCVSLQRYGYIRRLADGRFLLGPAPFQLGGIYQASFRLEDYVNPVLVRLELENQESSSFFIRDQDSRICLFRVDSAREVRHAVREGDNLPLRHGAGGLVLLAFAGETGEAFDRIREDLTAVTLGMRNPDVGAIACPVFRFGGVLVGAVSLSGPCWRFTETAVAEMRTRLLEAARELTVALGGSSLPFDRRMGKNASAA
ncbi:MAG: IclR family transcriptional regulator [Alphaproteobacteria bacterium]